MVTETFDIVYFYNAKLNIYTNSFTDNDGFVKLTAKAVLETECDEYTVYLLHDKEKTIMKETACCKSCLKNRFTDSLTHYFCQKSLN